MAVPTIPQETVVPPKTEAPVKPDPKTELINKISKPEAAPQEPVVASLDDIKDPVARKLVEEKIKNLEKGYNQKFMSLADQQKALETERNKLNAPWTPDRLKQELARQDFIQSAQQLNSERVPEGVPVTQDQWTYLTPDERAEIMAPIQALKREVDGLKQQNQSVMQTAMRDKIDTTMKSKWGDYEPTKVDSFLNQVNNREVGDETLIDMVHKALNFDRYIERAHKLGLEGRTSDIQEKINGSSFSGTGHSSPQEEPPKRTETETSPSYFKRLADWRRQNSPR